MPYQYQKEMYEIGSVYLIALNVYTHNIVVISFNYEYKIFFGYQKRNKNKLFKLIKLLNVNFLKLIYDV